MPPPDRESPDPEVQLNVRIRESAMKKLRLLSVLRRNRDERWKYHEIVRQALNELFDREGIS